MDYRRIAENMWSDIYEKHYDATENIREKVIAKAESLAEKPVIRKNKKRFAIPAVIGAAALVTVSAGAAMNWDINSLFVNYNDVRQTSSAEYKETTKWYLERDMYDVDGSLLYAKTDNYDDILSKIVHPVEKLCEYDDMDIYINGYAYDGYILEMYYDVIPKNVPLFGDIDDYSAWRHSYVVPADKSSGGSTLCYAVEGNTKKYMFRIFYRLPDDVNGSLYLLTPDDLMVETQMTYEELESRYLDYAFMIEKPDIPEYVLDFSPDLDIVLSQNTNVNIAEMHISPLSLEFGGMVSEYGNRDEIAPIPLYIEYDDGTVLDLSQWTAPVFAWGSSNYHGQPGFYRYTDTNGNLLDVTHMKNIRLYDKTIEINP